jgi:2-polyprenyl-3-methyl-5-hydroxy-6-metoxy-1,4-benzoquinol methylase
MPFVDQNRFPRLWLLMQLTIGGNKAKQAFAVKWYKSQSRVLEIGCSVGNVSSIFAKQPNLAFLGIDIDAKAIGVAKRRFRRSPNLTFDHCDLAKVVESGRQFDYILFAGILHHVSDSVAIEMLINVRRCAAPDAAIVIYDPESPCPEDSLVMRWFMRTFEHGRHVRTEEEYCRLIYNAGLQIQVAEKQMVSPGIVRRPYVSRFCLVCCRAN